MAHFTSNFVVSLVLWVSVCLVVVLGTLGCESFFTVLALVGLNTGMFHSKVQISVLVTFKDFGTKFAGESSSRFAASFDRRGWGHLHSPVLFDNWFGPLVLVVVHDVNVSLQIRSSLQRKNKENTQHWPGHLG